MGIFVKVNSSIRFAKVTSSLNVEGVEFSLAIEFFTISSKFLQKNKGNEKVAQNI